MAQRRRRSLVKLAAAMLPLSTAFPASAVESEGGVSVSRILPETVYTERRRGALRLNFDLILENRSDKDAHLTYLDLRLYDKKGRILMRRIMDGNGLPGAIAMLPDRVIPAGDDLHLFNPFPDLHATGAVARVVLRGYYEGGSFEASFQPSRFDGPVMKRPPLGEGAYVFTGNDLFAHHRRVSLTSAPAQALNMQRITQRFALDLTAIDPVSGELATGDYSELSNWPAYGRAVYAPTDGVVAHMRGDMPEGVMTGAGRVMKPDAYDSYGDNASLGNYVILRIDEAYLVLAHLKAGSLKVEPGQRIKAGDYIGALGLSGDTAYPHLHMQLQDGSDILHARPLPLVFDCVQLGAEGARREMSQAGLDSGDFVSPCK
ncbi:M23 family metallopeptidase [Hyphococcus sp.]|jgi:hypothetical protein|uniref:M23 family metallopeptidase n=1 Tax=Hyphococcus sp. TaxID=2038636 RepID=UPI003D0C9A57